MDIADRETANGRRNQHENPEGRKRRLAKEDYGGEMMLNYEQSCKEWVRGCSNTVGGHAEDCEECTRVFREHIMKLMAREGQLKEVTRDKCGVNEKPTGPPPKEPPKGQGDLTGTGCRQPMGILHYNGENKITPTVFYETSAFDDDIYIELPHINTIIRVSVPLWHRIADFNLAYSIGDGWSDIKERTDHPNPKRKKQ